MKVNKRWMKSIVVCAGLLALPVFARGDSAFFESVKRDTEELCSVPSRVPGSEGHAKASEALWKKITAIENVESWTHEFDVTVPVVKNASLTVGSGTLSGEHRIYPIWPDLVRQQTTQEDGITGKVIYVGDGAIKNMKARSLKGNIAAMEMESYEKWKNAFEFGAKAVLLLGGSDDKALSPEHQAVYKPRYYIPEGHLADAIRSHGLDGCVIKCSAEWKTVKARNYYALVAPDGVAGVPALAFAVPYDAMSIVMDMAPGADNALDAAFLLNYLREHSQLKVGRPILFAFLDAYSINQLGMRQFLTMATVTESDKARAEYHNTDMVDMKLYEELVKTIEELGTGKKAMEQIWNKRKYRELQRYIKDAVGPELLDTKEECGKLRMAIHSEKTDVEKARLTSILDKKNERVALLNRILEQLFTKASISDVVLPYAEIAVNAAYERIYAQAKNQKQRLAAYQEPDRIRNEILARLGMAEDNSPVLYLVGIDLSDAGSTMGPGLYDSYLGLNLTSSARDFTRWFKPILGDMHHPFWQNGDPEILKKTLDTLAVTGTEDPMSFVAGSVALPTSPAPSFELPGITWLTLNALRGKIDTPQDRPDRLNWGRVNQHVITTRALLKTLSSDVAFRPQETARSGSTPRWRRSSGSVVRESVAETVPRTPMPDFIVTLVHRGAFRNIQGMRRNEFTFTQQDGSFCFTPTPGGINPLIARSDVNAYKLNEQGKIVNSKSDNTSMISGIMSSEFDANGTLSRGPARLLSFPCREVNGPAFFDPRFLEPLSGYTLIDPMTGGRPKRSHFSVVNGQMWGLMLAKTRWQIVLRAGTAANRMMLMNIDQGLLSDDMAIRDAMRTGFEMDESLPSVPEYISARDFYTINEWRLRNFQEAGISSKIIEEIHGETSNMLGRADQAIANDSGAELKLHSISALANELRAYEALLAMGSDVTRGAIFLMILIVPFAVAMERLIFACSKIGHRIILSVTIFLIMTLLLWSFHPAFRITKQPLVIVMSFAILILSLFVIIIIMRKFEADLDELRSGLAESAGAQTKRGGVIGSAIWLGIANMRKRKLRTLLTGISIVLITFVLLCFSSSSKYQDKRQFGLDVENAEYSGVLIRQPRMRAMNGQALSIIENLISYRECAPRYWVSNPSATWRLHVLNPETGRQAALKAGMGITAAESELTAPQKILGEGWEQFADGKSCFLSERTASNLNIERGDAVEISGQKLILAGTFSSEVIDHELRMLGGQSFLPFDFSIESDSSASADVLAREAAEGSGLEPETDMAILHGDDLVIIPAELARDIGGSLRSIAIRTDDHKEAEQLALSLAKVIAFPMYYSTPDGVSVIVATPLIPKIPRNLVIPLILAALIIFNTMLNSVAERKKEIHIYTSLGLAPMHVGMLFLAEAVTYGLMGSVFGYIAGQGLATVLTRFDLMGGISLNYSGSSVIITMSLVIGVVVLSSIVPAIMAGKLAAPSDDMKWTVPEPVDGKIIDQLPFTISREAAPGLTAFVYSYMVAHEEGTIGKFASADLKLIRPDSAKNIVSGIEGTVWLAPYDLGVRQTFTITIVPDLENICSINIEIRYGTGQVRTWWRQNRVFLGELRRQILGWRKVKPVRILEYIEQFRTATEVGDKGAVLI